MIKIIDDSFEFLNEFKRFCRNDSFGTRIYSHYLCYGHQFEFVDFWVQLNSEFCVTAVFCRLEGDFVVSLSDNCDFDEVSAFISFQDKLSVTFDNKYFDDVDLSSSKITGGDILLYSGNAYQPEDYDIVTPEIKSYYELLKKCESDDFFVPEYMSFLADVSRRQQHQLCNIYGIVKDDTLVSCAMTVSYTDFSVILGAVATHPDYRKQGLAGCVVKNLAEDLKTRDSVYIYTTIERNTRFYESVGFIVVGRWVKYTFGG